jgi:peptide chain release factor 2
LKRFGGIFDVAGRKRRIQEIDDQSNSPGFWDDQAKSQKMMREKAAHERTVAAFASLRSGLEDGETFIELGEEEGDPDSVAEGVAMLEALEVPVREAEVQRMLSEEMDECSAILEINSGAGGTDASDWAQMLKRMYIQWATKGGYKIIIHDEQAHEEAGIKSVRMEVQGPYAYGYLKAEIGVHRLVRISPFDASARRHTAFASVDAFPDIDDDIEIDIVESDLRIDTYRASGAGGQHVNTTDSAVRITHNPTGIVVTCQNERSQHKNKSTAMKMLRSKLFQHEMEKRQVAIDSKNSEKKAIEWGSQIRSYVLHPYRLVKDLRTGVEISNTDKVLDGGLQKFMEAWLVQRSGAEEDA